MGRHAFTVVVLSHARCEGVLRRGGMNVLVFFFPLSFMADKFFVYWFLSFVFSYFLHYNGTPALFRLRYRLWDG